mgnify:CR=1 FL=1
MLRWWGDGAVGRRVQSRWQSKRTLYTIGDLRNVKKRAFEAEVARDVILFGPNDDTHGNTDEALVCMLVDYYQAKPDSYRLPRHQLVGKGGVVSVVTNGGDVVCPNLGKYDSQALPQSNGEPQSDVAPEAAGIEEKRGKEEGPENVHPESAQSWM